MGLNKHICKHCGNEYENYFRESKYCSTKCYDAFRKSHAKLIEKECPICRKLFKPRNSNVVYCSRKCSGIGRKNRIDCICDNCGEIFSKKKSDIIHNHLNFCSKRCMDIALHWSKDDENILINNYGKLSYKEIANLLSRDIKPHSIGRKAIDLGIVKSTDIWSNEEIDIVLNNYSSTPMNELLIMLPNRTKSAILHQARNYDLKSYFYLNRSYSESDIEYIKKNYMNKSYEEISKMLGRTVIAIKMKMLELGLSKPKEIANYKNLYNYVRQRIIPWRNSVREKCNYICEVTGAKSNIIVHHIISFNVLLEECIDILNFPLYDDFSEYSQEQLDEFTKMFLEIQESYNAYACITEDVHKQFHKEYGYGNNTQEQWDEFVLNYNNT